MFHRSTFGGICVKILCAVGSPRKYGSSYKLAEFAAKGARDAGAEVEMLYLVDYRIEPCAGCVSDDKMACRYPCIFEDDMKALYDKVLEASGVVISTPVYWYSPPGIVKNFIDRLTALENMAVVEGRSWVEGKVAGVIAVGNDSGSVHAISTLLATLVSMGFAIPPWGFACYNEEREVLEDRGVLLDAYNVGRCVAIMCKALEREERAWYLDRVEDLGEFVELVVQNSEKLRRSQADVRRFARFSP